MSFGFGFFLVDLVSLLLPDVDGGDVKLLLLVTHDCCPNCQICNHIGFLLHTECLIMFAADCHLLPDILTVHIRDFARHFNSSVTVRLMRLSVLGLFPDQGFMVKQ